MRTFAIAVVACLLAFVACLVPPDPEVPSCTTFPVDAGIDADASNATTCSCDNVFYVTPEFPDAERAALARAVARWNKIAVKKFCLADKTSSNHDDAHTVYRIQYRGPEWQEISKSFGGADVLGIYHSCSCRNDDRIGIVDVLGPDLFELVALHELGHAHGLAHTPAPSIMHEGVGTANNFTDIDLAECRRVGACAAGDAGAGASSRAPEPCPLSHAGKGFMLTF
jgi:hypothetical protein